MPIFVGDLFGLYHKLETAGYISVTKSVEGRRPRTVCRITPEGHHAFEQYVEALKQYIGE